MPRAENTSLKQELRHFSGSESFFVHPLFKGFVYTEGVKHLAEKGNAYWLIELVLSHQYGAKIKTERFQVWQIEVHEDDSFSVKVEDGNKCSIHSEEHPFTDLPLNSITLWLVQNILLLPSEY